MEEEAQQAITRLEVSNEQVHSGLIELLFLVQDLKQKVDKMEEWYERTNTGRTKE